MVYLCDVNQWLRTHLSQVIMVLSLSRDSREEWATHFHISFCTYLLESHEFYSKKKGGSL